MQTFINSISGEVARAFEAAGFDADYGKVTVSNRPDLCEFQCNGAMAAKKKYGKNPREIADAVAEKLADSLPNCGPSVHHQSQI